MRHICHICTYICFYISQEFFRRKNLDRCLMPVCTKSQCELFNGSLFSKTFTNSYTKKFKIFILFRGSMHWTTRSIWTTNWFRALIQNSTRYFKGTNIHLQGTLGCKIEAYITVLFLSIFINHALVYECYFCAFVYFFFFIS